MQPLRYRGWSRYPRSLRSNRDPNSMKARDLSLDSESLAGQQELNETLNLADEFVDEATLIGPTNRKESIAAVIFVFDKALHSFVIAQPREELARILINPAIID